MSREVDFGRTAADYAQHRAGFPESFFTRLRSMGVGASGQRVVDVGTGTGSVARGFARLGCDVVGIDPSDSLLEQARALGADGHHVDYSRGTAEHTGLADGSVDVYAAGQCWHWFDRAAAAAEAIRVLAPDGRIVICHPDWLPLPGNVAEATEQLILRHNPRWGGAGGNGIYPAWTRDLAGAGFAELETFSYDVIVSYPREAWRGRIRASAGVAASLSSNEVGRFDAALESLLEACFPHEPLEVPHRVWALLGRSPHP